MSRPTYTGEDIVKALSKWGFEPVDRHGSHLKLRYKNPDTGEVRNVSVAMHSEIPTRTLRDIADQAGAEDFQKFLDAIEALV